MALRAAWLCSLEAQFSWPSYPAATHHCRYLTIKKMTPAERKKVRRGTERFSCVAVERLDPTPLPNSLPGGLAHLGVVSSIGGGA